MSSKRLLILLVVALLAFSLAFDASAATKRKSKKKSKRKRASVVKLEKKLDQAEVKIQQLQQKLDAAVAAAKQAKKKAAVASGDPNAVAAGKLRISWSPDLGNEDKPKAQPKPSKRLRFRWGAAAGQKSAGGELSDWMDVFH